MKWIKLNRSLLNWQYKDEPLTVALLIHLLLNANYSEGYFKGTLLKKGQLKVGRKSLSTKTGLTEQQVRTHMKRLKSVGVITINATKKFSIISIVNWDKYQCTDNQPENQLDNQQTTNRQPTDNQQITTYKKKRRREEEEEEAILSPEKKSGDDVLSILNYFNEVRKSLGKNLGKNRVLGFEAVAGNLKHISARLREKYTIDDLQLVIRHRAFLVEENITPGATWKFYRPQTIFNLERFPDYIVKAKEAEIIQGDEHGI
jgi:uncharacterized phage protein (TIGR02220 family)